MPNKASSLPSRSNGLTKNQRRRLRRKQRNAASPETFSTNQNLVSSKAVDTGLRRKTQPFTRYQRESIVQKSFSTKGLSPSGLAFLKCAFAPPDFQASSVGGVPDNFTGQSLVKKHRYVYSQTFAANTDYYFLLAPSPAVAFFLGTTTGGVAPTSSQQLSAQYYTDFSSLWNSGTTSASDTVQSFRMVSNHFEIIPTVNATSWSGAITAYKANIKLIARAGGADTNDLYSITGLQALNTNMPNCYSGPFITGVYTGAYSQACDFEFQTVVTDSKTSNLTSYPGTVGTGDFGQLVVSSGWLGLDNNFESVIIKVTGVTGSQTALIKTWSCVEYLINPNSALYSFVSLSPRDLMAIEVYRSVINELPIGVPFEMNDSFWERVLRIMSRITAAGSFIPGPIGLVSGGANQIVGGLQSLML